MPFSHRQLLESAAPALAGARFGSTQAVPLGRIARQTVSPWHFRNGSFVGILRSTGGGSRRSGQAEAA